MNFSYFDYLSINRGYFRIVMGKNALGIESEVAWATPGTFSVVNFPCNEDGGNCRTDENGKQSIIYQDPSMRFLEQQSRHNNIDTVTVV
jgi:hypothetical protein